MKSTRLAPLFGLITAITFQSNSSFAADDAAMSKEDKISYAIGVDIGRTLKTQGIEVNPEVLAGALKDALSDGKLKLTDEEMQTTMMEFQKEMMGKAAEAAKAAGEKATKAGAEFIAKKKAEDGVKATESGLLYKAITTGKGPKPKPTDTVKVNYRGTLVDGTEFDSSYKRGEPASFQVDQVIPGWTEALQLMPVGSKYELYIPSELAYKEAGAGGAIGPNETLVFEVELLGIENADAAKTEKPADSE